MLTRLVKRLGACIATVILAVTAVVTSAPASAEDQIFEFYVVNYLPNPLTFARFTNGEDVAAYVRPNRGSIRTTETFTIGVNITGTCQSCSVRRTLGIDFDTIDTVTRQPVGAGKVEFLYDYNAGSLKSSWQIAGWPGANRNTRPRGWEGNQRTLYFID